MLTLFDRPPPNYVLVLFNDIADILQENQQKALSYYRNISTPPRNSKSILYRLINTLPDPMDYLLPEYLDDNIIESITHKARTLGFNTPSKTSGFIEDTLFTRIPEYASVTSTSSVPFITTKNPNTDNAIRFYTHPLTALEYPMLGYGDVVPNYGYAVYEVNITKLLYLYYIWYSETVGTEAIDTFIATVLLPNMLPSFTDISLINVFINNGYEEYNPFPKPLIDVSSRLKKYLRMQYSKLERIREPRKFDIILGSIPTLNRNISEIYAPVDEAPTSHVQWKRLISVMYIWNYLMRVSGNDASRINSVYINEMKTLLRTIPTNTDALVDRIPDIYFTPRAALDELINSLK